MNDLRTPKVSIGLPVYNGERYLSEALDSLLSQTFADFELIICDNASLDRTEHICRSYAEKDSRIRYMRNPANIGGNRNYALAFSLARGTYFRWAACDDLCAPTLLERCVEVLDRNPEVVLAYAKTRLIGDRGQVLSDFEDDLHLQASDASDRFQQVNRKLRLCNAVFGLIRTSTLKKTRLLRNFVGADSPFLAELSLHGKFWEVPERLFMRRIHPAAFGSSSMPEALQWCHPGARRKMSFMGWRHSCEYFGIALRAPLGLRERARVFAYAVKIAAWRRHELVREVLTVGHYFDSNFT
jgi:glycosyltransferase involved in cell wall biosynthesis